MKAVWMNFHAVFFYCENNNKLYNIEVICNVVELTLTMVFGHRKISALWFES